LSRKQPWRGYDVKQARNPGEGDKGDETVYVRKRVTCVMCGYEDEAVLKKGDGGPVDCNACGGEACCYVNFRLRKRRRRRV
jgi:transcription elongation factor Elf1